MHKILFIFRFSKYFFLITTQLFSDTWCYVMSHAIFLQNFEYILANAWNGLGFIANENPTATQKSTLIRKGTISHKENEGKWSISSVCINVSIAYSYQRTPPMLCRWSLIGTLNTQNHSLKLVDRKHFCRVLVTSEIEFCKLSDVGIQWGVDELTHLVALRQTFDVCTPRVVAVGVNGNKGTSDSGFGPKYLELLSHTMPKSFFDLVRPESLSLVLLSQSVLIACVFFLGCRDRATAKRLDANDTDDPFNSPRAWVAETEIKAL